ncbi:MAG: hypothetical protein JRJ73_09980 [Deltaproteobacteria bacterium]|nr:hypothetical protein [Deltaproteobacteria bacterium]
MSSVINNIQAARLVISSWPANKERQGFKLPAGTQLAKVYNYNQALFSNSTIQKKRQAQVILDFQRRIQDFLAEINLYDISDRTSLTNARAAISSAPDKILATASDTTPFGLHHVEIRNLTYPQTNVSAKLITTGAVSLDAGEYVFDLVVGEDTTAVDVTVVKTGYGADTNLDLLSKIGREIMTADDRLKAFLTLSTEPDADNVLQDRVTLNIQVKETGQEVKFYLNDTTGDLVENLKLNHQLSTAWSAEVIYDNLAYESNSNKLEIEKDRIALELIKPTTSNESISVERELEALPRQAQNLIKRYNDLLQFLEDNKNDIKSTITSELRKNQDNFLSSFRQIGLKTSDDGQIELTDRFFQALAAEPEKVRAVTNGSSGFFIEAGQILEDVLSRDIRNYAQPAETISYTRSGVPDSFPGGSALFSGLSLLV